METQEIGLTGNGRSYQKEVVRQVEEVSVDTNRPIINMLGEYVALGPFIKEHSLVYQRWMNDLDTLRRAGFPIRPLTSEQMNAALDRWTGNEERVWFVVYEVATLRPIGIAGLSHIDHCHRTAEFNICIGERDCRG